MIGVDLVEVSRFKSLKRSAAFLQKVFTKRELDYCFSFKDPAPHLAGNFAAKEAVAKALNGKTIVYEIEIRHMVQGRPLVWQKNKQNKKIAISISHTDTLAVSIALKL